MDDQFSDTEWLPAQEAVAMLRELGITDINRYFNCIMLAQGAITDEMRDLLLASAVSIVCLKRRRQRIKTDWCEGEILTNFETGTIESISGIKFECTMDVARGTTKATFLVTNTLLEMFRDTAWLLDESEDFDSETDYFN